MNTLYLGTFCLMILGLVASALTGSAERTCKSLKMRRRCPPASINSTETSPTPNSGVQGANASYSTTTKSFVSQTTESAGKISTRPYGTTLPQTTESAGKRSTRPYGTTLPQTESAGKKSTRPYGTTLPQTPESEGETSTPPYGTTIPGSTRSYDCEGKLRQRLNLPNSAEGSRPDQGELKVTLNALSTRRDPLWIIYPGDFYYQAVYMLLQNQSSSTIPSVLGYRGFEVQEILSNEAVHSWTLAADSSPHLELLLLYSGLFSNDSLAFALASLLLCELTGEDDCCEPIKFTSTPPPSTTTDWFPPSSPPSTSPTPPATNIPKKNCSCPDYNPDPWNVILEENYYNSSKIKNNAYNYALNRMTGDYLQPGDSNPSKKPLSDLEEFTTDGLEKLDDPGDGKLPETDKCILEVIRSHLHLEIFGVVIFDFRLDHEYRYEDKSKSWSHKPGTANATNLDANGEIIKDPRKSDLRFCKKCRFKYEFVAFLSYCPEDLKFKKP